MANRTASKPVNEGSNPSSPANIIAEVVRLREGWMDSIAFDHEVGNALGGNTVYPSEKDLCEHQACIGMDENCRPQRVYVVDAERYDAFVAELHRQTTELASQLKEVLRRYGVL